MTCDARQRGIIVVFAVITIGVLALPGCIAHGDYIRFCEFHGTLLDAASSAPIAEAPVQLNVVPESQESPVRPYHAATDQNGVFAIRTTIGGGGVTWLLFVPITSEERLSVPASVHLEIEQASRFARLNIPLTPDIQQRIKKGQAGVDLGDLRVKWQSKTIQIGAIEPADN